MSANLIYESLAYRAHRGSVISFCNCGSTLFLQGCLETLKKERTNISSLWLQGNVAYFITFQPAGIFGYKWRLFDFVFTFQVGSVLFSSCTLASSSLEWPLTGNFSFYKSHLLNAVLSLFLKEMSRLALFSFLFLKLTCQSDAGSLSPQRPWG